MARIALDIDSTLHITSHRAESCAPATARWLEQIGLPFDDLHCSYDKGLGPHLVRLRESTR
jgi:hypothetical protein